MPLHLTPFVKREGSRFLKETRRKTNLPDVVDQTAKMRQLRLIFAQVHTLGDVAGIDSDGSRVAGRVLIPGIESRDEAFGEREVRGSQLRVRTLQIGGKAPLLLVQE